MPGLVPGIHVLQPTANQDMDGRAFARRSNGWCAPAIRLRPA